MGFLIIHFFPRSGTVVPPTSTIDVTPPVMSLITATPAVSSSVITWTTDELSTSRIDYGLTTGYGTTVTASGLVTAHTVSLPSLATGTLYHYAVISADFSGNLTQAGDRTFNTPSPPVISALSSSASYSSSVITWTTDIPATSLVEYGLTVGYGSSTASSAYVTAHTMSISALATGSTYHFRVAGSRSNGQAVTSSDQTFLTLTPAPTGASYRLFSDANNTVAVGPDAQPLLSLGVSFSSTIPGNVTGIHFPKNGSQIGAIEVKLYDMTGNVLMGQASYTGAAGFDGWTYVPFSASIPVLANHMYLAAYTLHASGSGTYRRQNGDFDWANRGAPLVTGVLYAPWYNGGTPPTNGWFAYTAGYPDTNVFTNYWADPEFVG